MILINKVIQCLESVIELASKGDLSATISFLYLLSLALHVGKQTCCTMAVSHFYKSSLFFLLNIFQSKRLKLYVQFNIKLTTEMMQNLTPFTLPILKNLGMCHLHILEILFKPLSTSVRADKKSPNNNEAVL